MNIMQGVPGTEQICKHKWGYQVYTDTRRTKRRYYGFAKTLIQALMIRDYGKATNYAPFPKIHNSKTHEPYIHKAERGWMIVKSINGKMEYFGVFDRLEDAIAERDLLIKYGWNYDNMECLDEGNSWIDKTMRTSFRKSKNRYDRYSNW